MKHQCSHQGCPLRLSTARFLPLTMERKKEVLSLGRELLLGTKYGAEWLTGAAGGSALAIRLPLAMGSLGSHRVWPRNLTAVTRQEASAEVKGGRVRTRLQNYPRIRTHQIREE
jgi:hypothetical protein